MQDGRQNLGPLYVKDLGQSRQVKGSQTRDQAFPERFRTLPRGSKASQNECFPRAIILVPYVKIQSRHYKATWTLRATEEVMCPQ